MSPGTTAEQLRKVEVAYKAASRRAEVRREQRNNAIRTALAEGWTHQRISEATGLSRGRISQIPTPQHATSPSSGEGRSEAANRA